MYIGFSIYMLYAMTKAETRDNTMKKNNNNNNKK